MSDRADVLVDLLIDHLDRKSLPDRLKGKPTAEQAERKALLNALDRWAPKGPHDDVAQWFAELEVELDETATTHGWPSVQRIAEVARKLIDRRHGGKGPRVSMDPAEATLSFLAEWQEKHGTCPPTFGNRGDLTARLIARGILRDERHARFCGYALSDEQAARVDDQPMSPAEWQHHVGVWARITGQQIDVAERECRGHRGAPRPIGATVAPLPKPPNGSPVKRFHDPSSHDRGSLEGNPDPSPAARSQGPVGEELRAMRARMRDNLGIPDPHAQEG